MVGTGFLILCSVYCQHCVVSFRPFLLRGCLSKESNKMAVVVMYFKFLSFSFAYQLPFVLLISLAVIFSPLCMLAVGRGTGWRVTFSSYTTHHSPAIPKLCKHRPLPEVGCQGRDWEARKSSSFSPAIMIILPFPRVPSPVRSQKPKPSTSSFSFVWVYSPLPGALAQLLATSLSAQFLMADFRGSP